MYSIAAQVAHVRDGDSTNYCGSQSKDCGREPHFALELPPHIFSTTHTAHQHIGGLRTQLILEIITNEKNCEKNQPVNIQADESLLFN